MRPLVLVHGAANSSAVWRYWREALEAAGREVHTPDLRGHGTRAPLDLSRTTIGDYADDIRDVVRELHQPPVLIGWSMGGLVSMVVAERGLAAGCVCLGPSAPVELVDTSLPQRAGIFGPEMYGVVVGDPDAPQPMLSDLDAEERQVALSSLGTESLWARDERKRGVVVRELGVPLLIATGTEDREWGRFAYERLHLPADLMEVSATHWGLVLNRRALAVLVPRVLGWLSERGL